jgi:DNA-binding protein WhiA
MSFASETKNEICKAMPQNSCCQKAECYGLLLFAKSFSLHSITLTTENSAVAHLAAQLAAQTTKSYVDLATALFHNEKHKSAYTISVSGEDQRKSVLSYFGYTGKEISLRINLANLEEDCCESAFLRGVFLSCGTVTNPQKDYHLEFVVPFLNLARDFMTLLSEVTALDLQPAFVNRKGSYVVYIKGSERIADLLTYIGAPNAAMELMQVKMVKEVRNYVNRKTNFETANIDKTVSAATKQVAAIEKIIKGRGVEFLPEELREIASLRYENPEMSLRELGQSLSEPISRSGVNHRLQRIMELAENL